MQYHDDHMAHDVRDVDLDRYRIVCLSRDKHSLGNDSLLVSRRGHGGHWTNKNSSLALTEVEISFLRGSLE